MTPKKTNRIKGAVSKAILKVARRGHEFTNTDVKDGTYHRRQFATLVKRGKIVRLLKGAGAGDKSIYKIA